MASGSPAAAPRTRCAYAARTSSCSVGCRFAESVTPSSYARDSTRVTDSGILHPSSMHRKAAGAAALIGLLGSSVALAQDSLTLGQAIDRARAGNRGLLGARAATEEARLEARATRAELLPRVTVAESWQRGDQPVFAFGSLLSARRFTAGDFALDALNHPGPTGFFQTTVGAEHVLFDGGRRRSGAALARLRAEIASHDADETAAGLVVEVTRRFGDVLAAQAARVAADAGEDAAMEDLARAERRRDAGILPEADVLNLAVHLAELRERSIQAVADAVAARAELDRLIGDPPGRTYDVLEPVAGLADTVPATDALIEVAVRTRPSLRRAEAATELADRARRGARAAFIPQVAAQAAIALSGTAFDERASSWLVGGELRWSLSTGGAEASRAKAAAEAVARSRMARDDVEAQVEVEVISARARLEAARARVDVGRAALIQARESQRIIRDRFDAGLAGTDEVLRASAAVLEADARRTAAVVALLVSQADLDRATGRSR